MSDPNCIFCKIIAGEIPSNKAYEDDETLAFHDINPKMPTHLLVVPKEHIPTLNDLQPEHAALVGRMFLVAKDLAAEHELVEPGYRTLFNCGAGAGQEVFHIHLHILGPGHANRPIEKPFGE